MKGAKNKTGSIIRTYSISIINHWGSLPYFIELFWGADHQRNKVIKKMCGFKVHTHIGLYESQIKAL
ncbi:hypothetical protein GCM10011413_26580 [Pedobacter psychrotolerans]|uniref:Uncharacterized protein n=1 Tax=Pedobacter psychrotolerans TaxID=1843235 RepID=A0ABQ1SR81_9SPHI|nr:hypothetical protein GCM10011413_26580 [Pedobacter psychrotolerans]